MRCVWISRAQTSFTKREKLTSMSSACPFSQWEGLWALRCASSLCPWWQAAHKFTHCSANSDDMSIKIAVGRGEAMFCHSHWLVLVVCWNYAGLESVILSKKCDANQPAAAAPSLRGCADRGCWQGHWSKDADINFLALKVTSKLTFRHCCWNLSVTQSRLVRCVLIATCKTNISVKSLLAKDAIRNTQPP